ncbi:type VI secretion system Vgr family protein [Acinetobacter sp. V89_7]|uniref:type VI secretion system Vgr family protein n=1 Tax=Acinetobacter sp. V89_7 TaxID=3044233 RepID=UPI00249E9264|nr:type VI secretion system Vgr family protein [Acinetobacter sp. V89_7]MDI3379639.1 type VI secretion system Vgr family protein [Acinetobacter sp. V89_7]
MLSNMNRVLEQLGLGALKRAVHVQFSHAALNAQVFLQRIEGKHALNDGLSVELTCLSTNAHIALKQFIGCRVAVDQVTDSGALARTSGIITRATQGQSDGALTIYTLTLQDPTAFWHKRRNSRVFINKSVPEISEILFKEWQSKSRLFAESLTLDLSGLSQDYDIRPLSIQMNETDYEFLTRLWRSEGINWLVDEKHVVVAHALQEMAPQKLRLIDHNQPFLALERGVIRFHRSHATEYFDSMTQLVAHRQLQSTATYLQRWQADALIQDEGNGSIQSAHLHSEQHSNESLSLEQAWSIEPAWTTDLTGADQATISSAQQIEKLNQNMTAYQEFQAKYFTAHSSVRDAQVGYWFELTGHPEIDTHERADRQFLIYEKQFYNQNNLPKALQQQVERLQPASTLNFLQNQERQGNQLSLIRRQIKLVPDYQPLVHRPAVYPQRARVVGSENEEIHVDEWGRIKVRFLFTRAEDHAHDTGAGSNENDTDSAWVDVLTPWAGEQYGARFLPRVGELVVIDFFDGHVDRPFVIGRIHEGQRSPTKFDVKGQLPATRNLSGIRSKEVAGSGFNQLRFDDTTGQISAQLQSSHGTSQLNLGNLSHPKNEETSQGRGEGFELRTDHYGAVRAGQGMLISTYAQQQAIADHLEAAQAQSLLVQGHESMKMLSDIALKQQTDALNVIDRLPKFIQSLELKTTGQALERTLNLFKDDLNKDPIQALKGCGGFIEDIGRLGSDSKGVIEELDTFLANNEDALENLKAFIENVEEHGTDLIKGQLVGIKDKIQKNPFESIQDVGKVLAHADIRDFDLMSECGTFTKGTKLEVTPSKALSTLQGFMEGYTQGLESSADTKQKEQGKIFRQALMLLASPNGIALTTPENIILQASQDIAESASGSINLSAQKNIIGHAQDKVSLFAAQKGLSAYAAKGAVKIQAQDDLVDIIAKKVIKLISTEDKIELTSTKEIDIKAGGSQLIVNGNGVFIKTGGKFEVKSGQHVFTSGEKVSYEVPELPKIGPYAVDFLFLSLAGTEIENAKIQMYEPDKKETIWEGVTSSAGKSSLSVQEESKRYEALIGFDEWSSIFDDEDKYEEENEDEFEIGEHGLQAEKKDLEQ